MIHIDLVELSSMDKFQHAEAFDDIFNLSSLQIHNRCIIYIKYHSTKRKICKKIVLRRSILQSLIFFPTAISRQSPEFASVSFTKRYIRLIQLYQFHQRNTEFIHTGFTRISFISSIDRRTIFLLQYRKIVEFQFTFSNSLSAFNVN